MSGPKLEWLNDRHIAVLMNNYAFSCAFETITEAKEKAKILKDFLRTRIQADLSAALLRGQQWIPVGDGKPPSGRLLLLVSDKNVAIENFITAGHIDLSGNFWGGLPGKWIDLKAERWEATHWMLPAAPILDSAEGKS